MKKPKRTQWISIPKWPNGCERTVPAALRYLAAHDRPTGGEQDYNSEHLYQLADEIEAAHKLTQNTAARKKQREKHCGSQHL